MISWNREKVEEFFLEYQEFLRFLKPYTDINQVEISELVLSAITNKGIVFVFISDEQGWYNEFEIPWRYIIDPAGTIKELNDKHKQDLQNRDKRQREEDLKLLAQLKEKYPDA